MIWIAIVGSRNFPNLDLVDKYLRSYLRLDPKKHIIISGGASGVDRQAEKWADKNGFSTYIIPADWTRYGWPAGFMRNSRIVNMADEVYAFQYQRSNGTEDTIIKARKAKKLKDVID